MIWTSSSTPVQSWRRPRWSSAAASGGPCITLVLVIGLLWPTPTCALSSLNVTSDNVTEDHSTPPARPRCAPLSHDVLWTQLKLTAPQHPTLLGSSDQEQELDGMLTESSPADESRTGLAGDVSRTVATSTSGRHRRRSRRRTRPGRTGRRRLAGGTSWSCRLQKRWKRMPAGVFPRYVQTGTCRRQPTCMLGVYVCRPRRYFVKVLRRVTNDGCRPVPAVGPAAVYEEAWSLTDVRVTVACECSRRRRSGSYKHQLTHITR